jgi:uridine kinase
VLLVGIVGGSGAGKSWLAERLLKVYGGRAGRLSQDSFYRDRSQVAVKRREAINYDHPRAIDWPLLEKVLQAIKTGRAAEIPIYDFKTHCRKGDGASGRFAVPWVAKELVLVEGLWLLYRRGVRELLDLRIFLDCDEEVRFSRRLARDQAERGRSEESIRRQYERLVAPMHARFVAPQRRHADVVFEKPLAEADVVEITRRIQGLELEMNMDEGELRKENVSPLEGAGSVSEPEVYELRLPSSSPAG